MSWFDGSWDGPRAVTMALLAAIAQVRQGDRRCDRSQDVTEVVSCLKRSFTLGLDGGDDFLGDSLGG